MRPLPSNIEKVVSKRSEPDFIGEEGRLFCVWFGKNVPESCFYVKQWYSRTRAKQGDTSETSNYAVRMPRDSGLSIISPYFHKVLFYELKLIHTLFPANTIEMVLAYDQRILKQGNDQFDFTIKGYPVGVTRQVNADTKKLKLRADIINPVYDEVRKVTAMFDKGMDCTDQIQRAAVLTREGDILMAKHFGMDLLFFGYGSTDTIDSVKHKLENARPDCSMYNFLKSGFVPFHPSFNFIPQSPDQQRCDPCGTFIEFLLFDPDALIASTRHMQPDKTSLTEARVRRLRFYILLDRLFDEIVLNPAYTQHVVRHQVLQRFLFSLTEGVRKKFASQTDALQNQYQQASSFVNSAFNKMLSRAY